MTDEGGYRGVELSQAPLIRLACGQPPSPLWGEGFKVLQIRRNLVLCGTFGYIYWELGWSAPVGERGQSCRGPLIRLAFARHLPLKGKASGRPGVPPLRSEGDLYEGRVRTPAPTADGVWAKNAGAHCAPLHHNYKRLCIQEKGQV